MQDQNIDPDIETAAALDWINLTTNTSKATMNDGWYSVNWAGHDKTEGPGPNTTFFSSPLNAILEKKYVLIPAKIPSCCENMIKSFSKSQQTDLRMLFESPTSAVFILTHFFPTNPLEHKLFTFLVKKVYKGEFSDRNKS